MTMTSTTDTTATTTPPPSASTWQLQMFSRSLKKRQKLSLLLTLIGPLRDERCLLITNGDNNGAMNHHFRAGGGRWSWAELEHGAIAEMAAFLGETVHAGEPHALPFDDASFERVVVIDAHEHLDDVASLNREIARLLAPGGIAVVTTPNGDPRLPVAVLKRWIGMSPAAYGHVVQGYRTTELESMLREVGLEPVRSGAYSRFFTELAELAINFGYVKILSRKGRREAAPPGTIAPTSEAQLQSVRRTYRAYAAVYPFVRAFSALDALVPGRGGYAVAVAARKDG